MISRELNAIRGTRGTNFEKEPGIVQIEGHQRVLEHAVYTLANPVRAFLVATSRHWLGVSSVKMKYGVPVVVRRPQFGLWSGKAAHARRAASRRSGRAAYAGRTKMPETAELVIDRPPIMPELSDEELRALVLEQLAEREQKIARERLERGIQVVGRCALPRGPLPRDPQARGAVLAAAQLLGELEPGTETARRGSETVSRGLLRRARPLPGRRARRRLARGHVVDARPLRAPVRGLRHLVAAERQPPLAAGGPGPSVRVGSRR